MTNGKAEPSDDTKAFAATLLPMVETLSLEVAEIAGTLQIDAQTVRSTHHKAMLKLRAHFGEKP